MALLMPYGKYPQTGILERTVQDRVGEEWQHETANRAQDLGCRFRVAPQEDQGMLHLIEKPLAQPWSLIFVVLIGLVELTLRKRIEAGLHRREERNRLKTSSAGIPASSSLPMA